MSDDKDDLNGFDGLGKTNDDGMHFSEEELGSGAMAGFEKEFQDEEAPNRTMLPRRVHSISRMRRLIPMRLPDESEDGLNRRKPTRYCPKPRTRCHSTTSCRDCWATVRKSR